jgi:uncharacterized protein YecA (UPF0149 family)
MTTDKRRRMGQSAKPAKTMADYAMSFDRLGVWMSTRAQSTTLRHPQATSLSMLDGAVAAVVAGPVSMMPEEWVCPLLGVDPDDFNHDTETFSAIAATLMRHNAISNTLPTKPDSFAPLFLRRPDNGSERALRPCVVFRKITNGFRTEWGAKLYADIRSVIETARRRSISALEAIRLALAGAPLVDST